MNCNCTKACSIPYCITELEIGIVEPGLTGLVVQFTDVITGRVKKLTDIAPQSDGLLIVDVEDINAFFSPNFEYEIKVLFSDESGCETVPIIIDDQTVDCIKLNFVSGESTKGVIVLEGQTSQYMTIEHTRGNINRVLHFLPEFTGNFVVYWADAANSENILYSGIDNAFTYTSGFGVLISTKIRGDFSKMTRMDFNDGASSLQISNVIMPPVNSITNLDLSNNSLTSDIVNNILKNLDQNGLTNGTLNLSVQGLPAPPTGFGIISKANLIGKGWTVTTD